MVLGAILTVPPLARFVTPTCSRATRSVPPNAGYGLKVVPDGPPHPIRGPMPPNLPRGEGFHPRPPAPEHSKLTFAILANPAYFRNQAEFTFD